MGLINDLKKEKLWEENLDSPDNEGFFQAWKRMFGEEIDLRRDALITESSDQTKIILMRNGHIVVIPDELYKPRSIWTKREGPINLRFEGMTPKK